MKQKFFLGALMAGMAVFTACSSDDEMVMPAGVGEANGDGQEIVLQVANDGLVAKRGGRPLYSSEAAQDVDKVMLYAIAQDGENAGKVVLKKEISWSDAGTYSGGDGKGTKKSLRLQDGEKLPVGKYKFVAYAYNNTDNANTYTYSDATWEVNTTVYSDIVASLTKGSDGEEIFAGGCEKDVVISEYENTAGDKVISGFTATVLMARQVAGGFGYFTDIPAVDGATTLRLVSSMKNREVTFGSFNYSTPTTADGLVADPDYVVNGKTEDGSFNAKFNGSSANDAYVIYSIKLTDWFPKGDVSGDGLLGKADAEMNDVEEGNVYWQIPSAYTGKANFKSGSVFSGKFIIPFAAQNGKQTMELQLVSEDGATIYKSWSVKIPTADKQNEETEEIYSVYRNHMYNLGVKTTANPENPDEEEEDKEDPESLNLGQDLTFKVMSNWEALHSLVLGD